MSEIPQEAPNPLHKADPALLARVWPVHGQLPLIQDEGDGRSPDLVERCVVSDHGTTIQYHTFFVNEIPHAVRPRRGAALPLLRTRYLRPQSLRIR